jgi:hypothetical protein
MREDIKIQETSIRVAPIRLVMISKHGDSTSKCLSATEARELAAQLVKYAEMNEEA